MKVLVTGAGGFIGGRVLRAVWQKGWEPIGTSRRDGSSLVPVDIADRSSLAALRSKGPFDAIVHCAGIAHRSGDVSDSEYDRVNIGGTKNVAEFAAENGVMKFVHLSSVLVYGRHGIGIVETDECTPGDAYATSKLGGENAAADVCIKAGIALAILRPAPVIGEGCKGNFRRLISAIDRGRFVKVGTGSNNKSMIYVDDVAAACMRVLEDGSGRGVERFNVAAGPITVRELLASVYDALGRDKVRFSIPSHPLVFAFSKLKSNFRNRAVNSVASSLETWVSDDVYGTEAIRKRFSFEAQTPLVKAIHRTVAAYKGEISN